MIVILLAYVGIIHMHTCEEWRASASSGFTLNDLPIVSFNQSNTKFSRIKLLLPVFFCIRSVMNSCDMLGYSGIGANFIFVHERYELYLCAKRSTHECYIQISTKENKG